MENTELEKRLDDLEAAFERTLKTALMKDAAFSEERDRLAIRAREIAEEQLRILASNSRSVSSQLRIIGVDVVLKAILVFTGLTALIHYW